MPPFSSISWPEGNLGIAFSAGKDSSALLAIAKESLPNREIFALHIDHQARSKQSCEEECRTADSIAQHLDIPLKRKTLEKKLNSEAEWREERYRLLSQMGQELNLDHIATAHHSKDQSETILLNLLRGSDLTGLRGMPQYFKRNDQSFFRPLLNLTPKTLYTYLDSQNIIAFEDPSNQESLFKRNQLRHQILPLLESFQPGCLDRINQLAPSIEKTLAWQNQELLSLKMQLKKTTLNESEISYDRIHLQSTPDALLDLWSKSILITFAEGARKINRQHIEELSQFIKSEQLGYLKTVLPGNIQVRGQKRSIIFKKV